MILQAGKQLRIASLTGIVLLLGGCGGGEQDPDPIVQDFPIAYVQRPVPLNDDGEVARSDVRRLLTFNAGGDLYLRDRAALDARERNLTATITAGRGDVRDVEAAYDGTKLLFAMREPALENAADEEQPTWNIWEYEITSQALRRVIESDITAEEGQDVAPHYLPDGRIVFSSTRQRRAKAILLDEGKPQFSALNEDESEPALVLHVMNGDGSDIRQISFNQSHDLDPSVLSSGEIVFSRWDNLGGRDQMGLYKINPDGTGLELLYGAHSHASGTNNAVIQFLQPREAPDGKLLNLVATFQPKYGGGEVLAIDVANFIDHDQPIWVNQGLFSDGAQTPATVNSVRTNNTPSSGGRFLAAYPLWDGTQRLLVSWSPCRLMERTRIVPCNPERLAAEEVVEAPPLYGLYVYNQVDQTQLPVVVPKEGMIFSDVVAAQPRPQPAVLLDRQSGVQLNAEFVEQGVGVLHIRSVYDLDGVDTAPGGMVALADPLQADAEQRPARFLRIEKAVAIPADDVQDVPATAYGRSRQQKMREIVGYAPIEPDGSVMVQVPADVALAISVLDKNGRRRGARHQNWLQVRPGETLTCNGCHDHDSGRSHGRGEGPPALNLGAATSGLPFPNTDPALIAEIGETMAQTRVRISCRSDCAALKPSVDVLFEDVWTDAALRAKDVGFAYRYADLLTPVPVSASCTTTWTRACRSVIHYEQHIHPLWGRARPVVDNLGFTTDRRCTQCHSVVDAMGAAQVPIAQLDLSDGASNDEADHFNAYRELLFPDNEQELFEGTLQDRRVQQLDAAGNPLFETDEQGNLLLDIAGQPIPVLVVVRAQGPSMSTAGAAASAFFSQFDAGGSHADWLTVAELRLLAEWLDIGAQYYNNPFDAPTDD